MFMNMLQFILQVSRSDECLPYYMISLMWVNRTTVAMVTGLPYCRCAMRWDWRNSSVEIVFCVRYERRLKKQLSLQHGTAKWQQDANAINVWFALKIKKRQKKEAVDWRVNIMTCMWLNPVITLPHITSWRLIRHGETVLNCRLLI